jgi:hypothetical protein
MENQTQITTTKSSDVQHVLQNQPAFLDDYKSVHNEVLAQVMKSITHLNWNVPEQSAMTILVSEISNSIRNNYKQIRTDEISICFAKGIRGEYGEYMGLSVVTFEKFIMGYLASDYRANLGKTLPKAEPPAPSKELTRQNRIDFAQKAYEKYKTGVFYDDLGNIVYAFLDSEGLIPFTPSEKFEMLDQARQEEYKRLQNPLSVEEARRFNIQIEALMNGNEKIIPRSKKIALNKYFEKLFKSGSETIPFENSPITQQ